MDDRHECPAPGCTEMVPYDRLACRTHWFSLAKPLRDALWAAYNNHGVGSEAHTAAVDACIRALQGGAGGGAPSSARSADPLEQLRQAFGVPEGMDFERPPAFLMVGGYAELWRAWARIQRRGPDAADEAGNGWRVTSFPRKGGGCTMRLEVDFLPSRPS